MTDRRTESDYRGAWAYESIVTAIPGVELSRIGTIGIQFFLFEGSVLVLAAWYDLWQAVPVGTVAIIVATAGSAMMLHLAERIREVRPPRVYEQLLFDSNIDVVMGLVAYIALITFLFVVDPREPGTPLVETLFGPSPPVVAVFVALLILWDVCYRIGIGWWAGLLGLWRSYAYRGRLDRETRTRLLRADLLTIGFAAVQLLLIPFVRDEPLLAAGIVGHVAAVIVVAGVSVLLLAR